MALLMTALGLTTPTLAGVLLRTGRMGTLRGRVALAVGAVLVPAMTVFGWAVTVVSGALGLAVLVALRGEPALTRFARPTRTLSVWPLGGVALVVLDEVLRLGPVDEYGDHPLAWLIPYVVCASCSAAALALVGARACGARSRPVVTTSATRPPWPRAEPAGPGTPPAPCLTGNQKVS